MGVLRHIRINDLAKELGLKSKAILAVLPFVGITAQKNHSSSVNEDEAYKLRAYFRAREKSPQEEKAEFLDKKTEHNSIKVPEDPKPDAKRSSLIGSGSLRASRPQRNPVKLPIITCPYCNAVVREDR